MPPGAPSPHDTDIWQYSPQRAHISGHDRGLRSARHNKTLLSTPLSDPYFHKGRFEYRAPHLRSARRPTFFSTILLHGVLHFLYRVCSSLPLLLNQHVFLTTHHSWVTGHHLWITAYSAVMTAHRAFNTASELYIMFFL